MLQVSNLSFETPNAVILRQINFSLPPGHLLHVKGKNGAGKTTLLKLVAGLLAPTQGSITFQGHCIEKHRQYYQQQVCYVGHKPGISLALSVRENLQSDFHYGRRPIEWDHWMAQFGLTNIAEIPCDRLSAGQRRRVGLVRLLMSDARLWLLDEPLVALDNQGIICLKQHIKHKLSTGGGSYHGVPSTVNP